MNKLVDEKAIQQPHNHQLCMTQTLLSAETICMDKGVRLTAIRRRILELICSSHKAIGAYELLDLFREEDSKAKPVTIYRALDFLMDVGLVHKIESLNAFIGCLQAETKHQSIILICDNCKNAFELDATSVYQTIFAMSKKIQFSPTSLTIELHGLCFSCS
jgi:Fur family zinc uptake transcriptional regulator